MDVGSVSPKNRVVALNAATRSGMTRSGSSTKSVIVG